MSHAEALISPNIVLLRTLLTDQSKDQTCFKLQLQIRHRRRGKLRILLPICAGGALTSAPLPYQTHEIESDEKAAAEIYLC